ncbi:ThuA domain-containing protein [Mucilaginibacter hurinus]|uniref:ThuA domain-containing protein n=1 Tax=Mucilaginibacter hurinus TaxID=2201324 RepID=A0A367GTS3_9SPHI|nr:ThuA domain-containing protein [Mucilaginibacter hurinus]RCH56211.1 ThuA domain-containing protein [Mucilaginibacter hurinus]
MKIIKTHLVKLAFMCLLALIATDANALGTLKGARVLVYTKNGQGFVHDNIPAAVACIQKLGKEQGFKVDVSADPAVFNQANLKQYTMLIFPSTNNDVFDTDAQRLAFRHYIEAGGGFVGIHSVTGTERKWTWFKQMIGCTFAMHDFYQKFSVKVIAPKHPSVQGLPKVWDREDECYFGKELYPGINVVMAHDLTTLKPGVHEKPAAPFGSLYPAVWYQTFDGGTIWITTLGHSKHDYSEPVFVKHILNGIAFVASQTKKTDFTKAYALTRDDAVRY